MRLSGNNDFSSSRVTVSVIKRSTIVGSQAGWLGWGEGDGDREGETGHWALGVVASCEKKLCWQRTEAAPGRVRGMCVAGLRRGNRGFGTLQCSC